VISFARGPASEATRSRISPAALLVKVTARMFDGSTPMDTRYAIRVVITRVFPVPAPASTSSGPSVVDAASRCEGFRASRRAALPGRGRA
jgi:hypothetical protein